MKRPFTAHDGLQYYVDRTFSSGSIAIIIWLAVLSTVLVVAAGAVLAIARVRPGAEKSLSFSEATWASLMRTLDPGTMGGDVGWEFRLVMLLVTLGGIFVISTLIGVITSGIESKLDELGRGRSRVVEKDHTLILGWSPQVFTVVSELVIANENRRDPRIVILGNMDKRRMVEAIEERVGDTRGTRVVCRTGDAIEPDDLDIVSIDSARSVIVLSSEESEADAEVIKTILAIARRPDGEQRPYHVVAAVRDPLNLVAAKIAGGDLRLELVPLSDMVARVIAQTCRQSGLSTVYSELLDFAGDEIYFAPAPALAGRTFGEALLAYQRSSLLGLFRKGGAVRLNPPMDTVIQSGDEVIAISADDDTIIQSERDGNEIDDGALVESGKPTSPPESTLVLGWNWRGPSIVKELDHYVAPGSHVLVATAVPIGEAERAVCCPSVSRLRVSFQVGDPTDPNVLGGLPLADFDHVIVLAAWGDVEPQRSDARTLVTLLHLRDLGERQGARFSIVTEIRDARNQRLAEVTRADDFVVSDRLVSQVLAQVSEHEALNAVLEDLFDPDGSEIYIKPATAYVAIGRPVSFYTVVEAARRRGEVAFGYRILSRDISTALGNGIVINPDKTERVVLESEDRVIVLAHE